MIKTHTKLIPIFPLSLEQVRQLLTGRDQSKLMQKKP
jgi:hypothetical protein